MGQTVYPETSQIATPFCLKTQNNAVLSREIISSQVGHCSMDFIGLGFGWLIIYLVGSFVGRWGCDWLVCWL